MATAREKAAPFVNLYIRINATGQEVREQIESDWEMVAGYLRLPVPRLAESRELIAKMVEERKQEKL